MNIRILALLLVIVPLTGTFAQTPSNGGEALSVMTWNIRYNNPGDGVNAWPERKGKVSGFLWGAHPSLICMQEVLAGQLKDLATALPEYEWFGAGRDDGGKAGEFVPIFYKKERFHFVNGGHFWLSETPDQPGKLGWDAACTRMVTWLCLADQSTNDTLFVMNTHFDHIGTQARMMSAKLLTHAADSLAGKHPVIITGDFNSTEKDSPYREITGAGFRDSRRVALKYPIGPSFTFTGFDVKGKPGDRIDFIFVRNTKPVKTYIVNDESSNGFYFSDHLPVLVGF